MSKPRGTIYGTCYGALMRLAHRFNWHHTRTIYPDGDTLVRCDWCGLSQVTQRRDYKPAIYTAEQERAKAMTSRAAR